MLENISYIFYIKYYLLFLFISRFVYYKLSTLGCTQFNNMYVYIYNMF